MVYIPEYEMLFNRVHFVQNSGAVFWFVFTKWPSAILNQSLENPVDPCLNRLTWNLFSSEYVTDMIATRVGRVAVVVPLNLLQGE